MFWRRPTAPMSEHGLLLGLLSGTRHPVFASFEDSLLVVGPPRSGKTTGLVIPIVAEAPGAVATTSTRPDVLRATVPTRRERGPVLTFDPQGLDTTALAEPIRWSPVEGCDDPLVAVRRAAALAAGVPQGGSGDPFWPASARALLQGLLHAAALGGESVETVATWVMTGQLRRPAQILRGSATAAPRWAEMLDAFARQPAPTIGSTLAVAQRALDALALPQVTESVCPPPGEGFDARSFLRDGGALYVLGLPSSAVNPAPLITALVDEIVHEAHTLAAESSVGLPRLDPPLLVALDEAANLAPHPDLPSLLATSGGSGIVMMPVLQSLAQAIGRWGPAGADALRDSATMLVALGGIKDDGTLRWLSTLAGEREIEQTSTSTGPGGTSESRHTTWRPTATPDRIRALRPGTALIVDSQLPLFTIDLLTLGERQSPRRAGLFTPR